MSTIMAMIHPNLLLECDFFLNSFLFVPFLFRFIDWLVMTGLFYSSSLICSRLFQRLEASVVVITEKPCSCA